MTGDCTVCSLIGVQLFKCVVPFVLIIDSCEKKNMIVLS